VFRARKCYLDLTHARLRRSDLVTLTVADRHLTREQPYVELGACGQERQQRPGRARAGGRRRYTCWRSWVCPCGVSSQCGICSGSLSLAYQVRQC